MPAYYEIAYKWIDGIWVGDAVIIWSNWDDIEIRQAYGRLESATIRYNIVAKEPAHADEALRR